MVFYVACCWISRLKVHDAHFVYVSLEWYCNVQAELPRRLYGHVLQDDKSEVIPLPWYSIARVESRHKVSGVTGKRQESTVTT